MDSPLIAVAVVIVVSFFSLRMIPRLVAGVPFVDPDKVYEHMQKDENAVLLDVRTPEEFATAHALDSINVQPHQLGDDLESKRAFLDHKVYVICLSSQRAAMSAKNLKNLGFTNVSVVKGGLNLWKKRKLPVT
ncbi:rhodanese-like domain-containing protein [Terasakiella sp.]|uniref:rhodanese-like domain-containing protein n=1 Tax=Terasakiella sp. TaxID=2034861 RepID=UPI003AA8662B